MSGSPYPPDFIKLPPIIACAGEEDALIVTMARILGLCWRQKYRRSPPYAPERLAELVGRPRTTLYRHLAKLQQLQWLQVDHRDRQIVLRPLVPISEWQQAKDKPPDQAGGQSTQPGDGDSQELCQALEEAGIMGRPLRHLLQQNADPVNVRAWYLWTFGKQQEWMDNPVGYIVNRLRDGDVAPQEFVELAQLTADETGLLRSAWVNSEEYQGWPSLDGQEKLQRLAPLWARVYNAMKRRDW